MDTIIYFVDVIVPAKIPQLYTYRVPMEFAQQISIGQRVFVEFGKTRVLTAIIAKIHTFPPQNYEAKYIEILDEYPVVTQTQIDFWHWIAEYYMCTVGEVMIAAIPSGLRLSGESHIALHPNYDEKQFADNDFSTKEERLIVYLSQKESATYEEVAQVLAVKSIHSTLQRLIEKNIIIIFDQKKEKYKPKKVTKIRLAPPYHLSENIEVLFSTFKKKDEQQEKIILRYLSLVPLLSDEKANEKGVEKKVILEASGQKISESALQALIKKGVIETFEVTLSRLEEYEQNLSAPVNTSVNLSEAQQKSLLQINDYFAEKDIVLLHGITGSGKTEVYIRLIQQALSSETQVLLLLPEIALTTQIVVRLRKIFGNKIGVYHSKYSDNERVEVWNGVLNGEIQFVIGVRSSIFLPFNHLGLVIIDEEHESSYKQQSPSPHYQGRDAAIMLAKMHNAKVLLGSATPSIESYFLAKQGKYGLVKLQERYAGAVLPEFVTAPLLTARKQKTLKGDFTPELLTAIEDTLSVGKQVLLFQNRRGYSPYISCEECAWIPECERCNVSLTYHLYRNELRCHYCGYKQAMPQLCPACGSTKIKTVGIGTQKIEDDIKLLLPQARVERMDADTTRQKYGYENIINDFQNKEIDILVGTQMITKGLDFNSVNLVGIINADSLINFPDFRSHERAFQTITQVGGRAGRRNTKGKVIIQTATPQHYIIQLAIQNDYEGFYEKEIIERKNYHYPPFTRLIALQVKALEPSICDTAAEHLKGMLVQTIGAERILGPQAPAINRIRNYYLKDIYVKLERNLKELAQLKKQIRAITDSLVQMKDFKKVLINIDVDTV
jgi:primosomal protein N' (replication factor Y)